MSIGANVDLCPCCCEAHEMAGAVCVWCAERIEAEEREAHEPCPGCSYCRGRVLIEAGSDEDITW